jgi:hypothetical protein
MGMQVNFLLKNTLTAIALNQAFNAQYPKAETPLYFITDEDNRAWLADINTNEKSPQRHLKPADRDLRLKELTDMFSVWTTCGMAQIDVGFSRTSVEDMGNILAFTAKHRHEFKEISGIRDVIERSETGEQYQHLSYLDTTFEHVSYELSDENPIKQGHWEKGGVASLLNWGNSTTLAVYGNCESPCFLKQRKYIDPSMDPLRTTKDGKGIMLFPTLPLNANSDTLAFAHYEAAHGLSIREPMSSFMCQLYPMIHIRENYPMEIDEAKHLLTVAAQLALRPYGDVQDKKIHGELIERFILTYLKALRRPGQVGDNTLPVCATADAHEEKYASDPNFVGAVWWLLVATGFMLQHGALDTTILAAYGKAIKSIKSIK